MISLIIPHIPSAEADEALERCLNSFKDQYDELILIINDGMGYGVAVNLGLKWAQHDFLVVSNNDIELTEGSLRYMESTMGFIIPTIDPEPRDYKPRAIFGMHRWVYDALVSTEGHFYDPRFTIGYFEDDDLHIRAGKIPMLRDEAVFVRHLNGGGLTMKKMGEQKWFDINEKIFKAKYPNIYS